MVDRRCSVEDREREDLLEGLDIVAQALRGALALAHAGADGPASSRRTELAAVLVLASQGLLELIRRLERGRSFRRGAVKAPECRSGGCW